MANLNLREPNAFGPSYLNIVGSQSFKAADDVQIENWIKDLNTTGYSKVEAIFKLKQLYLKHKEVILAHDFLSPTELGFEETSPHPRRLIPIYERHELFEKLRENSLGVILALLKDAGPNTYKIVRYLLDTVLIPECLHCIVVGGMAVKSMGVVVLEKILEHDEAKFYLGSNPARYKYVTAVLSHVAPELSENAPDAILLMETYIILLLKTNSSPKNFLT
ncbi:uncharacterized protein [Rutidosis leptorrhynchoides]|uniref:uncharacterized protein n=1 Tax=Rutidosis leptorrhynchoides TaxID=125765 RepID=UPI003A991F14